MTSNSIAMNVIQQESMNDMTLEECRSIAQKKRSDSQNVIDFKFYDFIMQSCDVMKELYNAMDGIKT